MAGCFFLDEFRSVQEIYFCVFHNICFSGLIVRFFVVVLISMYFFLLQVIKKKKKPTEFMPPLFILETLERTIIKKLVAP